MKAAYYNGSNQLPVETIDEPKIKENELLIRVKAASICGTDLRISKFGHFRIPKFTKRVLGHEIAGVIEKTGTLLKSYEVGMRVSVTPNIGCGVCEFCRDGFNNMCPTYEAFGISLDGGFQETLIIPSIAINGGNVFQIPDGISFEEAALIEPLSCCYNALLSVQTSHEDVVLVIGAGPIGALHVMLNRLAGAKKVMVADIRKDRLKKILEFGADVIIDTSVNNLYDKIQSETGGKGVDVVITAVSVPEIQTQAIELLKTHGRVNFFAGLGKNAKVELDTNAVHYKGLKLAGTTGSTNSNYFKCLTFVKENRIGLKKLISETFPLDEINKAFEFAASGNGLKTLITYE